jgi:hypothetical protein
MPSGCGGWVFLLGRHGSDGRPDMSDGETFGWNGSFSDAKREAIKYAAEKGYTFAKVCS